MKGCFIFQEDVFDEAEFERYRTLSPQSIKKYGDEFIVRGGEVEALEGAFNFQRLVSAAFASVGSAKPWFHSADYAFAKEQRPKISKGDALSVADV